MNKSAYPFFPEFTSFFKKKKERIYKKGQIIIYAGDQPSGIFYIEKGYIKVYTISKNGNERIHMFLKKDEIFPLIWPFKKNQNNLFYQAVSEVVLRIAENEIFHEFLHDNPESMHAIAHKIIDMLDIFIDRVENLQSIKSYNRLITRLLFLAKRFGISHGKSVKISIPTTHLDIANTIAMTRETISRDMETLLKKRLISQKSHLITIRNVELLKKELST